MGTDLKKFVNPKFIRTIGLEPMRRLLERHRESLEHFELRLLDGEDRGARAALEAFFAGPQDQCPDGLVADLHRITELGTVHGLRLILGQAIRMGIDLPPEGAPDDDLSRQDPKHMAVRVFLDFPKLFEAAADMLALTARSSLSEFAGVLAGIEADLGTGRREAFKAAAATMLEADHCGQHCRVGWYEDADCVNAVVTHGSIVRTAAVLRGQEEHIVSYRAAEHAVLSYSAATGRIKIGGGTPLRRSALAELFADKVLGRSGFFAGPDAQNLYTLAPIERVGCDFAFTHAFDKAIRRVRIVEAQADQLSLDRFTGHTRVVATSVTRDGDGGALHQLAESMRSRCFAPDWRLRHVVIRVNIDASTGRPGQVTVKIRPPASAIFSRHWFEERIMTLLQRNGLVHERYAYGAVIAAE
jgi:hypothetical protein